MLTFEDINETTQKTMMRNTFSWRRLSFRKDEEEARVIALAENEEIISGFIGGMEETNIN